MHVSSILLALAPLSHSPNEDHFRNIACTSCSHVLLVCSNATGGYALLYYRCCSRNVQTFAAAKLLKELSACAFVHEIRNSFTFLASSTASTA